MKRLITVLVVICAALLPSLAEAQTHVDDIDLPSPLQQVFAGMYHFRDAATGDTLAMIVFNPITVFPPERFRNKAEEQFYWRTVRDVKRTLPYAKLIGSTLLETYEYLETYPSQKAKQDYLIKFEKQLFNQYKPQMKKLTKNQGKLLIKLVNRETNQTSYNIVKAFMGTFKAGFWQTFGRFFGANLKDNYRPDTDRTDAMIERICVKVEQGAL